MANRDFDIKTLFDIPEWEKIQDKLAELTGVSVMMIDYKGMPASKHSACTGFCSAVRADPALGKRCGQCDALAGLEAARINKPFLYRCHCGAVDAAVPVMIGERYIGAVIFGQVRVLEDGNREKLRHLVEETSSLKENKTRSDLEAMYEDLPELTGEKVEQIAELLGSIVNYIVKRAVKERADRIAFEYKVRSDMPPVFEGIGGDAAAIDSLSAGTDTAQSGTDLFDPGNLRITSPVYPALCYIGQHPGEPVGMKEMADLCNLSPAYFSRLFKKELGENFTDYVNRRKIGLAKEALRGGKDSVSEIATRFGFQDASYFVKVFRRYEGVTPTAYRKHR